MNTNTNTPAPVVADVEAARYTQLQALTHQYTDLTYTINEATDRRKHIAEQIVALTGPGKHPVDGLTVSVTVPRRLDAKALAAAYPVTQNPILYKPTIDTAAVRKHIADAALDAFKTEGNPVVTIR